MIENTKAGKKRFRRQFSTQISGEEESFIKKRQAELELKSKPNKNYLIRLLSLDGYENK